MRLIRIILACFLSAFLLAISLGTAFATEPDLLPAMTTAIETKLNAKAAVLMDMGTQQVLLSKNPHQPLPIASITKVMTMLLTLEALERGQFSLTEPVTATAHACSYGGSQIYLEPGEQFTVEEMLKAVTIKSANDAAVALAEHVAGSESAFVAAMNQRAAELGMENTHFINACGLDSVGVTGIPGDKSHSSAYDVALMSVALLKHRPIISEWLTTRITYLERKKGPVELYNTNHRFLRSFSGGDGLKTGLTDAAGFCLTATAEREGFRLIAVALGVSSDVLRYQDVSDLLNYGFANYSGRIMVSADSELARLTVNRGQETVLPLVNREQLAVLLKKGESFADLEQRIDLPAEIFAPVEEGDPLGRLQLWQGKELVGETPLVAAKSIPRLNFVGTFLRLLRRLIAQ